MIQELFEVHSLPTCSSGLVCDKASVFMLSNKPSSTLVGLRLTRLIIK